MHIDKNPLGDASEAASQSSAKNESTKGAGDFLDLYETLLSSYAEYLDFVDVVKDFRREIDLAEQKYLCRRLQAKLMLDHGIGSRERARELIREADEGRENVRDQERQQEKREDKLAAMREQLQDREADLKRFRRQLGV